ncbi:helix-turn-helix domain-containing protein [Microbacterium ureisolvens]|uniref:helix-turn-helix domain-containing protein n=1 Tax=Microbacterium ureisolvens TaxID=2781186 RepID=UPI001C6EF964|nr:helix-turn-helix domain-containing protein [Microbacterium ureisolvens]
MRYKVVVTKVEVAELWVRATDEEAAAQKVRDELTTSWAYAGHWETKATQVDVVASDPEPMAPGPQPVAPSGPMLLKLKDAATELGISYGTLHALMKDGGIEYTKVGSGKYISRASLAAFIEANTQR